MASPKPGESRSILDGRFDWHQGTRNKLPEVGPRGHLSPDNLGIRRDLYVVLLVGEGDGAWTRSLPTPPGDPAVTLRPPRNAGNRKVNMLEDGGRHQSRIQLALFRKDSKQILAISSRMSSGKSPVRAATAASAVGATLIAFAAVSMSRPVQMSRAQVDSPSRSAGSISLMVQSCRTSRSISIASDARPPLLTRLVRGRHLLELLWARFTHDGTRLV